MPVQHISALTVAVRDMSASIEFYCDCGFALERGGPGDEFSTLRAGQAYVNLLRAPDFRPVWWGRVIFRVGDVDALYRSLVAAGRTPHAAPADADWGERYFHITDPDGHELSFAQVLG